MSPAELLEALFTALGCKLIWKLVSIAKCEHQLHGARSRPPPQEINQSKIATFMVTRRLKWKVLDLCKNFAMTPPSFHGLLHIFVGNQQSTRGMLRQGRFSDIDYLV
jgi:hypothetical protein